MCIELKGIFSTELNEPELPDDPECCAVNMFADIGTKGSDGSDQFNFLVVTPKFLIEHPEIRWSRGYLLMPEFSWQETRRMVERLASSISANSWEEAAKVLCNYMEWEFENYQPYKG
ncbi:MAG TPA: Imm8 family immunity protein [Methylobacter sp.]|jgi:hypothetical protein